MELDKHTTVYYMVQRFKCINYYSLPLNYVLLNNEEYVFLMLCYANKWPSVINFLYMYQQGPLIADEVTRNYPSFIVYLFICGK